MSQNLISYDAYLFRHPLTQIDLNHSPLKDLYIVKVLAEDGKNKFYATGLLISQKFVLTVAHIIYSYDMKKQLENIRVELKIKGQFVIRYASKLRFIPQQFKQIPDKRQAAEFDYCIFELESKLQVPQSIISVHTKQNQQETSKNVKLLFNKVRNTQDEIIVVGFSLTSNYKQEIKLMGNPILALKEEYSFTLKCDTGTAKFQRKFIKHRANTGDGMSGGLILQYIEDKIKLVGIHIGCNFLKNKAFVFKVARREMGRNNKYYNLGIPINSIEDWINNILYNSPKIKQKIKYPFSFPQLEKQINQIFLGRTKSTRNSSKLSLTKTVSLLYDKNFIEQQEIVLLDDYKKLPSSPQQQQNLSFPQISEPKIQDKQFKTTHIEKYSIKQQKKQQIAIIKQQLSSQSVKHQTKNIVCLQPPPVNEGRELHYQPLKLAKKYKRDKFVLNTQQIVNQRTQDIFQLQQKYQNQKKQQNKKQNPQNDFCFIF